MFAQGKDDPITKMFIQRNENSIFRNGSFQNLSIVGPCLSNLRSTDNIMAFVPQRLRYSQSQHLIDHIVLEVQAYAALTSEWSREAPA